MQFLRPAELEALIMALHKTVQRSLPVTLVGAGLPQIRGSPATPSPTPSGCFGFPTSAGCGLDREAREALARPAAELGVAFSPEAVDLIVNYTEGYPYFLQEYGKIVWNLAPVDAEITLASAEAAAPLVEAKLDESFFRVRDAAHHRAGAPVPAGDGRARTRASPYGRCRRGHAPPLRAARGRPAHG